MERLIGLFMILYASALNAQNYNKSIGIQFDQESTWAQIRQRAKEENKLIFIDCFATWCGPCKQMDKEIYTDDKVGRYFNDHFISVRLQGDTTLNDSEHVRQWYKNSEYIRKQYNITAYPSYLFFSPDGKVLHKATGYKSAKDFVLAGQDANTPGRQYYPMLEAYEKGELPDSQLRRFAIIARNAGNNDLANKTAREYVDTYLLNLPNEKLYTRENIEFIRECTDSTNEKSFLLFKKHGTVVNKIMDDKMYSRQVLYQVAYNEFVFPPLDRATVDNIMPDWKALRKIYRKNFGHIGLDKNILFGKISWYRFRKDLPNYFSCVERYVGRFERELSAADLNDFAYWVFYFSSDSILLKKAVFWSDRSIQLSRPYPSDVANFMDTKANITYRLNLKQAAIKIEEQALGMAISLKDDSYTNAFKKNLSRMKSGEPTWQQAR